ncbi:MAG: threonine/serine dehydratase [Pseudomonadota bacterium]
MVDIEAIRSAFSKISPYIIRTPLLSSPLLDKILGYRLFIKAEMLQTTGAFKLRGATHKLMCLSQKAQNGVVAFSSGNHAQAVACATQRIGVPSHIIMPSDAPLVKLAKTRAFKANVITYNRKTEDREKIALALAVKKNIPVIKPYDDFDVIKGQGTLGLEIALQCQEMGIKPTSIALPVGGGGLASGCAIALHHYFKDLNIYGVEPFYHDDVACSLKAGKPVGFSSCSPPHSICDSVVTPIPGSKTFPILKQHLSGVALIHDQDVLATMRVVFDHFRLVVEPGGVLALAAFLTQQIKISCKHRNEVCVAVLSGGNTDESMMQKAFSTQTSGLI